MFKKLSELILPYIIGAMVHKKEKLTPKEFAAQKNFLAKLKVEKRKTSKPVIVAMIGLVGSGKSSVAREFARHIGATVVEGDEIRVELRKQDEYYEGARKIAENAALGIIEKGGNVVLDSDHIDAKRRASLREKARKAGVRVVFVCTYCDFDVMVGRVLSVNYRNSVVDFFGGASSKWQGSEQSKGVVVKVREMWRRTPHHYRWENKNGGRWVIRKPPCVVLADIDTTNPDVWMKNVEVCARTLLED